MPRPDEYSRAGAAHTVAVIPARGGSKGVPGKNLMRIGGLSLVARAVRACRAARTVDAVYVSTDDADIARAAAEAGAGVISRPAELAGDSASSEAALEHALGYLDWVDVATDILVFVQCTSPFIDPAAIDRAVELVAGGDADTVFAGVETYDFLWRGVPGRGPVDPVDHVEGQNHDAAYRPRRQERNPDYRETGAFYVMNGPGFRARRHRFFGRTAVVGVPPLTAVEIDTLDDVALAAALAPILDPGLDTQPVLDVDAVITDFDGVHTDDTAFVTEGGAESVRVSRSDGLGVERLRRSGVPLLIVSKETNPVVRARAEKLGVEVLHGIDQKTEVVRNWLRCQGISAARTAYLGNDVNDLGPMGLVGWPIAVADAQPEVRAAARRVLNRGGGHGAVRELCELVLSGRAAAGTTSEKSEPVRRPTLVPAAEADDERPANRGSGVSDAPAAAGRRHAAG